MSEGSRVMSLGSRLAQRVIPGVRASVAQVPTYAAVWDERNAAALVASGPLWVVLGDSAAQGVGADSVDAGWVGQLRPLLDAAAPIPWRLVNLSRSGARTRDVLDSQLPRLDELTEIGDVGLVTCAVGGNDLLHRTPLHLLMSRVEALLERLPPESVVATVSKGLGRRRAEAVNGLIRTRGVERGLRVADVWAQTGPPWRGKYAKDGLHPNAVGYAEWTAAFAEVLGVGGAAAGGTGPGG